MFTCKENAPSALYFPRTFAVHTMFMKFPINVCFLDKNGKPIRMVANLKPWRVSFCLRADAVLEYI
jgi:uncharacterized membrane protein (UPF0127 family)